MQLIIFYFSHRLIRVAENNGKPDLHPDQDFRCFFIHVRQFYLCFPYQPVGKIKCSQTLAARRSVITSSCRISVYSGFSGSLFHVFFQNRMRYLVVGKKIPLAMTFGFKVIALISNFRCNLHTIRNHCAKNKNTRLKIKEVFYSKH